MELGKVTNTETNYCPYCEHKLNAMTGMDHTEDPRGGDVGVCFYCGEILRYQNDSLKPRKLFPGEDLILEEINPESWSLVSRASKLIKEGI